MNTKTTHQILTIFIIAGGFVLSLLKVYNLVFYLPIAVAGIYLGYQNFKESKSKGENMMAKHITISMLFILILLVVYLSTVPA